MYENQQTIISTLYRIS